MEALVDKGIPSPVFYQGRITHIIDPQNFWMQIGTDKVLSHFYKLEAYIEEFCNVNESWLKSVKELSEGQLVLVDSGKKEKVWRRGQVARIDRHENMADILYVDYGNTGIVPAGKICPQVPDHIMDQTQFAMRCSLAGVQPIGRTWTSRGIRKLQELMEDQVFQTLVLYSRLGSVVVALYFNETRNGRSVAHFLLDEEVAMPSEEIEIPEFAKDVPPFLVAYAADYSNHSDGRVYSDETTTETQHVDSGISNDDMEKKTSSDKDEITVSLAFQNSVPVSKTKSVAPPPGFTETVNNPVQTLVSSLLKQEDNEIKTDDQNNGKNDQLLNDISMDSNVSFLTPVVEKSDEDSNILTLSILHPQILVQETTSSSSSGMEDDNKSVQIMSPEIPVVISGFNLQQIDHTHELSTHGLHHKTIQQKRLELEEEKLDIISEIEEHAAIAALAGYGGLVDKLKHSGYRDQLDSDVFQEISASIRDAVTRGDSKVTECVQGSPAHSPSKQRDQGSRSPRKQKRKTKDSYAEEAKTQRGDNKESDQSEKSDQRKELVNSPSVVDVVDIDIPKVVQEILESGKTEGMENTKVLLFEIIELISAQETKLDKRLEDMVESLLVSVVTEPDTYFTVVMEVLDKVQGDMDLKNFLVNSVRNLQERYIKVHVTGKSQHRSCARMIGGVFNLSVAWDDSNSTIQSVILTSVEKWIVFNMKGTQSDQDDRQAIFLDCFDDFWLVSGSILSFHNPEMVSRLQEEIKEKVLNEGVSRCIRERLLDMLFQNFFSLTRNPERCSLGTQTEREITPDGGNKGRKSTASQTNRPKCSEKGTMTEDDWPSLPPFKIAEENWNWRQRTDKSLVMTTKDNLSGSNSVVSPTGFNGEPLALRDDQSMGDTIMSKTGQASTFESQVFIRPIVKTKPPFYHHSPSPQTSNVPSPEGSFFVTPNKSHGSLVPSSPIDEADASKESKRSVEKEKKRLPKSASLQSTQPVSSETDKDPSNKLSKSDSTRINCEKKHGSKEIDWFDYDPSKHKHMQKQSAPKLDDLSLGDIAAKWISSYSKTDQLQEEKRENPTIHSGEIKPCEKRENQTIHWGANKPCEKLDSVTSKYVSLSSMDRNKEMLEHSTSTGRTDSLSKSGNSLDKPCKSDGAYTEGYSKLVRDDGKKEIIDWWNMDDFGDKIHNNGAIISNDKLQDHNSLLTAHHCENKIEDVDNTEEVVEPVSNIVSDKVSCAVTDVQKKLSDEKEIEKLKKMYASDEEYDLKWQARNRKAFTKVDEFAFDEEDEDDEGDWEDLDDSADVESDYSSGSKPSNKGYIIEGVYHRAPVPKWVPGTRKCTTCGETNHLVYNCPNADKSHLI